MNKFKIGDRVKCIDIPKWNTKLELGKEYTVRKGFNAPMYNASIYLDNASIYLEGIIGACYYYKRFELVKAVEEKEEEKPKFKVGDRVKCVDAYPWSFEYIEKGKEYIVREVETVNRSILLRLEGVKGRYYADRFELVKAVEVPNDE